MATDVLLREFNSLPQQLQSLVIEHIMLLKKASQFSPKQPQHNGKTPENALEYSKRVLAKSASNTAAFDEIMAFYRRFEVDMSGFKFNREEANER